MLKVLLLALVMLITNIVNGISGILGTLTTQSMQQPPGITETQNTSSQGQASLQQTKHRQRNIKTNLKSLPQNLTGVSEQAQQVTVSAGDKAVSRKTLQSAVDIVNNISLPTLRGNIGLVPSSTAQIVLFSSKTSYANALQRAGVSAAQIPALVNNSGGVTVDSDIWIPLYALQDRADLANVLTHELTHVVFNQLGIGDQLPTWINEGTAWYDGLAGQTKINSAETKLDMAQLQNEVVAAARSGKLYPLSANEQDILNAPYNIEYEDYLAVNYMVQHYGKSAFQAFLKNIANQGVNRGFQNQYGFTIQSYETSVYNSLIKGQ